MEDRAKIILSAIIKEHIKTGLPVGSEILAGKYDLNISSATIRNEMADLEKEGYIIQPYTSAGRIPTAKAYHSYLERLPAKKMPAKDSAVLTDLLAEKDEHNFKQAAKAVAKISGNAVFWAFHRHNVYYTGLTNLLEQPEFTQSNVIYEMGGIIDRLDEIVDKVFDDLHPEVKVMLGENNPFGHFFGTVISKYKHQDKVGMVGILGPIRMDYEKNISLINFLINELQK